MRKRSEAVVVPSSPDPVAWHTSAVAKPAWTEPSPPVIKLSPQELAPHVTVVDGVVYLKCADCGLDQTRDMALLTAGPEHACFRCKGNLDPDGILTEGFFSDLVREIGKHAVLSATAAPSPVAAATGETSVCETCGKAITVTALGLFYNCGHDKRRGRVQGPVPVPKAPEGPVPAPTVPAPPSPLPGAALGDRMDPPPGRSPGEMVTATFGEESFSPRPYNSFRIGPFSFTTPVHAGETPEGALQRAADHLRAFAEKEFDRKTAEFLARLASLAPNGGAS